MSKGKFWEHANTQALTAYDIVYASLIAENSRHTAHVAALVAYDAVIAEKRIEYAEFVAAQRRYKKYTQKEILVLEKMRQDKPNIIVRFAVWVTTSKRLCHENQ